MNFSWYAWHISHWTDVVNVGMWLRLGPSLNRFNRKLACVSTTSPHAIQTRRPGTQGHFVKNCMAPENLPLDFRMIKILESFYRYSNFPCEIYQMQKWRNVSDLQSLFYFPPLCSYSNPNFNGCRVFGVTIPMQLWHCDPRKAIFFSTSWDKASNSKVWDFEAWEVRYKKMILSSHEWLISQVSLCKSLLE